MKKGLAILFAVLCLLLCACHRDTDTVPEKVTLTNGYSATPLSAPETIFAYYGIAPEVNSDGFSILSGNSLYRFAADGTYRDSISVPYPHDKDLSHQQVLALTDGSFLTLSESLDTRTYSLYHLDRNGDILQELSADGSDAALILDSTTLLGRANGEFYLFNNTTAIVYDEVLSEQRRFLLSFIPKGFRTLQKNGIEEIYLCDAMGSLYLLDGADGMTTALYVPEAFDGQHTAYAGEGYSYYLADAKGIYGVTGEEQTLLCDLGNSFLSYSALSDLYVLSPDVFLVKYKGTKTKIESYYLLTPADTETERSLLRIAWLSSDGNTLTWMQEMINDFNTSHTEYAVELVHYGKEGDLYKKENSVGYMQFQKDLLAGEAFDLYAMQSSNFGSLFSSMEKNGSFYDLSEFYDTMLPCMREAFQTDTGIFGLPYGARYMFLTAPADRDGSLQSMLTEIENCAKTEEDILCAYDLTWDILNVYMHSMPEQKYDTLEFVAFLQALKTIEQARDTRYGRLDAMQNTSSGYYLAPSVDSFWELVRMDHMKYVRLPLSNVGFLGVYKYLYDVPAHMTGFPTAQGGTALYGDVDTILSVPKNADLQGAKTFLTYYLSDTVQTDSRYTEQCLPVTESALQAVVSSARYFYYMTDIFNHINFAGYFGSRPSILEFSTINHPDYHEIILTDDEIDALCDLIRGAVLSTGQDDMVTQILSEELEPYFAGNRTAEATAEIIEKRAGIYLAE